MFLYIIRRFYAVFSPGEEKGGKGINIRAFYNLNKL